MKLLTYLFLALGLLSTGLQATTYIPQKIEERIKYAHSVVRGTFQGSTYKKLPSGEVYTTAKIALKESAGLNSNKLINSGVFDVLIPGGTWNGYVHRVSGTPTFKIGEEVVLVLAKGAYGPTLLNLSMSKFNVKKVDGRSMLISSVFPDKENVGSISLSKMNELLKNKFGEPFTKVASDRFVYTNKNKIASGLSDEEVMQENRRTPASKSRRPASIVDDEDGTKESLSIFWLILALGLLGFFSTRIFKGSEK